VRFTNQLNYLRKFKIINRASFDGKWLWDK
jgi:hypothetical protein